MAKTNVPSHVRIGDIFGRLTVVGPASPLLTKQGPRSAWRCRCECGAECDVSGDRMRYQITKSCGCLAKEYAEKRKLHGLGDKPTPEYRSWVAMRTRCRNPNSLDYPHYGGRGVQVCARWDVFMAFFSDMGPRPRGTTLDRIDANGNYQPENCRWATPEQQAGNKRGTARYEFRGQLCTVPEIAAHSDLCRELVWKRLKAGVPAEMAIVRTRTRPRTNW